MSIQIRDMTEEDEWYVGTCTHVEEKNEEIEQCAQERITYFKHMNNFGLKIKVALFNDQHAGFIYLFPIEVSPREFQGKDLFFIPCLVAHSKFSGHNIGKALIDEAENEAGKQNKDGIAIFAIDWDYWFMPVKYFIHLGFKIADRKDQELLLWKKFNKNAIPPQFIEENYSFTKINNKVVIDLFYNTFCQTSAIESKRVRSVVKEFGEKVILNEFPSDDRTICAKYGISRAIYINGKPLELNAEIDKEILREYIKSAIKSID